jgi:hypothetical protein
MDVLLKHLDNIISMDRPTLVVILVLCAVASYLLKEYLASPPMIIFVYPVLVLCSVLIQYGFILLELYPSNKLDLWLIWTIMACMFGNLIGIGAVAMVANARDAAGSAPRK